MRPAYATTHLEMVRLYFDGGNVLVGGGERGVVAAPTVVRGQDTAKIGQSGVREALGSRRKSRE